MFVPAWSHAAEIDKMRAEDPVEKIRACSNDSYANSSCRSQQWHSRRRVYGCQSNSYRPGLFKFFERDHISNCKRVRGPDILRNVIFSGYVIFLPNQHNFRKYIIFSLLSKCIGAGWNGFTGRILPASRCVESPDIDRRVVTAHAIVGVQHQSWTVVIYLRRHGHNFLNRNTVTWRQARGNSQHRSPTTPTELFTKNPAIYFPEVDKTCVCFFGMLPGFLENLLESGNFVCSATSATKTAMGIIQLWFHYFRGILTCTFPGRLSKEMPR